MQTKRPLIIRVYGDSLGMPRSSSGIGHEKTYAELISAGLQELNPEKKVYLYNRSQGAATIEVLFKEYLTDSEYFGNANEQIIIFQFGIVDCAPRPIPYWLRAQISKLPSIIRIPIIRFLHHNRAKMINLGLKWKHTSPSRYGKIQRKMLEKAARESKRVYYFNVLPTLDEFDKHSPGFNKSIVQYNAITEKTIISLRLANVHIIDVHRFVSMDPEGLAKYVDPVDGHHITLQGHRLFSSKIVEMESDINRKENGK